MAIVVKHSGNAAPALVGAYGGGQGKRQAEDAKQRLSIAARAEEAVRQQNFAERQAMLSRRQQRQESSKQMDYTAAQRELDRTWRSNESVLGDERATERAKLGADLGDESRADQFSLRNQLADLNQDRDQEKFTWEYSEKQRREVEQITAGLDEFKKIASPEEYADAEKQAALQMAGITPDPKLKKPDSITAEQALQQIYTDPETGTRFIMDKDGRPKKFADSPKPPRADPSDYVKAYESAIKMSTGLDGIADPKKFTQHFDELKKILDDIGGTQEDEGPYAEARARWSAE